MSEQKQPGRNGNWPKDEFGRKEVMAQFWWVFPVVPVTIALLAALLLPVLSYTRSKTRGSVVAYCAQDQVYAESIFKEFEAETGIKVRAVFDSEAVKTVGLANRLLAERPHPQCDVFWGNEEMRTRQLAAQNVFRETNGWAAFGYRSRRMVINTNHVAFAPAWGSRPTMIAAPGSLVELTNEVWRGKVALAYPQFGTTATHFHALRQHWGEAGWEAWCRALAANKPLLVDGNSVVVKMVGRGEAWIGLTDSDDIAGGREEGLPVAALPIKSDTLLIPNTVGVVRGAPHPGPAQQLVDFLQRPQVTERLVAAAALEGGAVGGVATPTLKVDWGALLRDLERTTAELNVIFLR